MKRKQFSVLASLFLVLAIVVSCSPEPYSKYPSVDCTIYLDGQEYDLLEEKELTVRGNGGTELPILPSSDSRVFVGWSTSKSADDVLELVDGRYYPERNGKITLYAIWANTTVNIYFHSNYGDEDLTNDIHRIYSYNYHSDSTINGEVVSPINKYEFAGWYTSRIPGEGEKLEFGKTRLPLEDTHYYAQWKKPVTITWKGVWNGEEVFSATTETKAFENIVFPDDKPEDKVGEYRFANAWIEKDSGEEIKDSSTVTVYEDLTFEAKFGKRVNITYYKTENEDHTPDDVYLPESEYLNYMYLPYNLPTPTEEEIPNFGAWFLLDGDDYIKVDSDMIVNSDNIILHARSGSKVTIEADLDSYLGKTISSGEVVVIKGFNSVSVIKYPYVEDYSPKSTLYIDEECTIPLTDITGALLKNVEGYTDKDGYWIGSAENLTLYSEWKEPKLIGGDIMYKNKENTKTKYLFFDKDFNILTEDATDNIPTYSGGNGIPYYYSIEGDESSIREIKDSGYIIVYNNNGKKYKENLKFWDNQENLGNLSDYEETEKSNLSGLVLTEDVHIYNNKEKSGTIGNYVYSVRTDSEVKDWFIPSKSDIEFITETTGVSFVFDYLDVGQTGTNHIWSSSYKGIQNNYKAAYCLRTPALNMSTHQMTYANGSITFLMRII